MARQKDWKQRLLKRAKVRSEKTKEVHEEVTKKRAKKKSMRVATDEDRVKPDTPSFGKLDLKEAAKTDRERAKNKSRQTDKSVVNWFTVQSWFKAGILKNNPAWLGTKKHGDKKYGQMTWVWDQKNCAERLLKAYTPEEVEKTVAWFCDNWQAMMDASDNRLSGAPTVNLLWVSRERIFADAALGKVPKIPRRVPTKKPNKRHMVGEYDAKSASKSPDFGWGNV